MAILAMILCSFLLKCLKYAISDFPPLLENSQFGISQQSFWDVATIPLVQIALTAAS